MSSYLAALSASELRVLVVAAREARKTVALTRDLPDADWMALAVDSCELLADAAGELERRERASAAAGAVILAWRPRGGVR